MKGVPLIKSSSGLAFIVALAAVLIGVTLVTACGDNETTTTATSSVTTTASASGSASTGVAAPTATGPVTSNTTSTTIIDTTLTTTPVTSATARASTTTTAKPTTTTAKPTTTTAKPTTTTAAAATIHVAIQDFSFQPSSVTINVGDRVVWTNQDPADHTVVADGGGFGSSSLPTGGTFAHRFSQAGTYPYHCSIHPSMTGVVTVR